MTTKDKVGEKLKETLELLKTWKETDIVRAGYIYRDIERNNEAFARGWRFAMKECIDKLEQITNH